MNKTSVYTLVNGNI